MVRKNHTLYSLQTNTTKQKVAKYGKSLLESKPIIPQGPLHSPTKGNKTGVSNGGIGDANKAVIQATNLSLGDEGGQIIGKPLPLQRIRGQDVHNLQASGAQSKHPRKKKPSVMWNTVLTKQASYLFHVIGLLSLRYSQQPLLATQAIHSSWSHILPPLARTLTRRPLDAAY